MSPTHDQADTGSHENMGAANTKNQASKGLKSGKNHFHSTRFKQLYAYLITALRNTSEETRNEFADTLEEVDLEDVDVEEECRNLENIGDE